MRGLARPPDCVSAIPEGLDWLAAHRWWRIYDGVAEQETSCHFALRGGPKNSRTLSIREAADTTRQASAPATTQYADPATGKFIVVNNSTGSVVQISGPGFRPNPPMK